MDESANDQDTNAYLPTPRDARRLCRQYNQSITLIISIDPKSGKIHYANHGVDQVAIALANREAIVATESIKRDLESLIKKINEKKVIIPSQSEQKEAIDLFDASRELKGINGKGRG